MYQSISLLESLLRQIMVRFTSMGRLVVGIVVSPGVEEKRGCSSIRHGRCGWCGQGCGAVEEMWMVVCMSWGKGLG